MSWISIRFVGNDGGHGAAIQHWIIPCRNAGTGSAASVQQNDGVGGGAGISGAAFAVL
jgi:hypothetical protein